MFLARAAGTRPGTLVLRDDLETALYTGSRDVNPNAIEALVSRVRKKLGASVVLTERGPGYQLGSGS